MIDREDKLIERAINGEKSAFAELYDHYHPQIYRFILLKVGAREEAEDLTQKVFLSALTNIGAYRHLGHPFGSWLYRIARNHIADHYRGGRDEISLDKVDSEIFVGTANVASAVDGNLEMDSVKGALAKLKPEYQDILILRFVEELSLKEIASALDKSVGAVKLMQHRAMRALRNALNIS